MQFGNAPAGCRATEPPAPPAVVRPRRFQSDAAVLRLVIHAIMETEPGLVWRHQARLVADAAHFLATGHACPAERARAPLPGPYVSVPDQLVDVEAQAVLDRGPATTPVPPRTRSAHFTPSPFLSKSLGNFIRCLSSKSPAQLELYQLLRIGPPSLGTWVPATRFGRALRPARFFRGHSFGIFTRFFCQWRFWFFVGS